MILISSSQKTSAKLVEGTILFLFFALFVHLTTSAAFSSGTLAVSACMILIAAWLGSKSIKWGYGSTRPLLIILTALAGGFWSFSFFKYMGLVLWPLSRAVDLTGYIKLLYFHVVLSLSVLTPILIIYRKMSSPHYVLWSDRKKGYSCPIPFKTALWFGLSGVCIWAISVVLSVKITASGPVIVFFILALIKSALTGATEEIAYRGIIQPAAITRFGVPMGIVFQSCLYTTFHMHLGPAFFSHTIFLGSVMALGLVFGSITYLSGGIRWAVAAHTAINLVIEWHNLS